MKNTVLSGMAAGRKALANMRQTSDRSGWDIAPHDKDTMLRDTGWPVHLSAVTSPHPVSKDGRMHFTDAVQELIALVAYHGKVDAGERLWSKGFIKAIWKDYFAGMDVSVLDLGDWDKTNIAEALA